MKWVILSRWLWMRWGQNEAEKRKKDDEFFSWMAVIFCLGERCGKSDKYILNMKLGWKKYWEVLKNAVISRIFNRWYRERKGSTLKNHSEELKGWKPGIRSLADYDLWKNRIVVFNKWWTDLGVYPMNFSGWFFGKRWTFQVLIYIDGFWIDLWWYW